MIQIITTSIRKIQEDKTDLLLLFEDDGVSREQYTYLQDKVADFKSCISPKYGLNSKIHYDRCSGNILLEIKLTIPNPLIHENFKKDSVFTMDLINKFKKFYETQIEKISYF
jgi:hypothetical protein